MPDALLQRSTFALDKEAWDRLAYFAFRPELFYDHLCEVKPTNQTQPGSIVTFTKFSELAEKTSTLGETTDVDAVTFSDSKVQVTINEYGNAVKDTRFLHATSYIPLNPVVANVLGYNAGISMDSVVRDVVAAGTNVYYAEGQTARANLLNTHTLAPADIRKVVAKLRSANVPTYGGLYAGYIHPDVSVDFRETTGGANWADPHVYSAPSEIWNGQVGTFGGVKFMETPRAKTFADGGAGTDAATVYATMVMGRQAIAKAFPIVPGFGPQPRIIDGPVTDKLRRFVPMGWYHVVGYARFREESLRRIESGSSLDEDYTA